MSSDGWYKDKRKVDSVPRSGARDLDIIIEQREEISRLKQRINRLEQRRNLKTTPNAIPAV